MNYVYDVLVNFKYPLIDFFEWNKDDDIINFKKIPLFKIKECDFLKIKNYKFKTDISNIRDNSRIYNSKKSFFSAIYTDGIDVLAINYNKDGISIGKSVLLFDEEQEILESSDLIKYSEFKYEIISKDNINMFMTLKQADIMKYLSHEIKNISNEDKLRYIYYECFNKIDEYSKDKLMNMIESSWDDKYYKIYDFFRLISMNK